MTSRIDTITELFQTNRLDEAQKMIEEALASESNEELFFWLGKVHYKKQQWGKAMNAFTKVLELKPDHQEAQSNLQMAKNILGYFTPDMFNP
ncbi:MAG TPA: tetratricopeptide repeat protein [Sunxiuqinia sp.]|nr:tetratricopeptide repeat protein [Sunxiuqinia sp.]